jgi:hypothetical protein
MEWTQWLTLGVIIAATLGLIVYDVAVAIEPTPGDTISEILLSFGYRHPTIPWVWGGITGHLFWPMRLLGKEVTPIPFSTLGVRWQLYKWVALATLIALTLVLIGLEIGAILPAVNPVIPLLLGISAGHFGWPQMKAWAK